MPGSAQASVLHATKSTPISATIPSLASVLNAGNPHTTATSDFDPVPLHDNEDHAWYTDFDSRYWNCFKSYATGSERRGFHHKYCTPGSDSTSNKAVAGFDNLLEIHTVFRAPV